MQRGLCGRAKTRGRRCHLAVAACFGAWLAACATTPPPPMRLAPDGAHDSSRAAALRGDLDCKPADPDCNVCAPRVMDQLAALFDPHNPNRNPHVWQARSGAYAPSGRTLHQATGRWWAVPRTHVQGFVRTSSERYPYAISYSHWSAGSVLLIERDDRGWLQLGEILEVGDKHPSGLTALGRFVLFAGRDAVRVLDVDGRLDAPLPSLRIRRRDPKKRGIRGAGGGLAAARLGQGRYLLLAATPGGSSDRPRTTRFYELRGALPKLRKERFLGEVVYVNPPEWTQSYARSENVSLVTECTTGTLYALYTTGDDRLGGEGYVRVSRIDADTDGKPALAHVAAFPLEQSSDSCHIRSSATLYVDRPSGEIRFLCHQRAGRGWELELGFEVFTSPPASH